MPVRRDEPALVPAVEPLAGQGRAGPVKEVTTSTAASQWGRVYSRWRAVFLRSLWRTAPAGLPPEDALHDAMLKCMAAPASLANDDEARAYLHQVVRNRVVDEAREHGAGRRLRTVPFDEAGTELAALSTPADAGPFQTVARRQHLLRLSEALDELPERQREAFVLHRFDGLAQEEVALRMGISRRMVVKHLARAMTYCQVRVRYASAEQMRERHQPGRPDGVEPQPGAGR